jgi:Protein of unknown function (DUF1573)
MSTETAASEQVELRGREPWLNRSSMMVGLVLAPFALGAACYAYGGREALRAVHVLVSGRSLVVDHATKSFGVISEGDSASIRFHLTNRGNRPVRVVGCMKYCNCLVPDELPLTLGPGEDRDFDVVVRTFTGEVRGEFESIDQPVRLYTTDPGQAEIKLRIEGTVRGAPRSQR